MDIGTQYQPDDAFKAEARLFQSKYRAEVLKVHFQDYGNRLTDPDAEALLNYYHKLNSKDSLRKRYPNYDRTRDADMLRSEHIPFNLLAPLDTDRKSAIKIIRNAFQIDCDNIDTIKLEYAPKPKESYLFDGTSFDTYIGATSVSGKTIGVGIEIKYTEQAYKLKKGSSEETKVLNKQSPYWETARASGFFKNPDDEIFGTDEFRQVWRNHLLGLKMIQVGDIDEFYSITLFPNGNKHFHHVIPEYISKLKDEVKPYVIGCTFEKFISLIQGSSKFDEWKEWLKRRYIINNL